MKICPCIDTIYKETPLNQALTEITQCGYSGFEFWFYKNHDLEKMADLREKMGLTVVNMNSEIVSLTDPRKRGVFLKELETTIHHAKYLGCKCVTVLSGDDTGADRMLQHESIVAGLREAAVLAEAEGVMVVLEASNRRVNRPKNYLTAADEAFQMIEEIGSQNVKMLYDIYHQQISEGDLLRRILPNMDKIGHFHAAGVPDRHELHLCEINYDYILKEIEKTGYQHWIGLEYYPAMEPEAGLRFLSKYL